MALRSVGPHSHLKIFSWITTLCIVFLFSTITSAQTSSNTYPGGARNWSGLTWVGGTPPTTNNASYTENLTIATIGNGDNLTIDISFSLTGNLTVSSSGSNPTITIPAGVTVVIIGNLTDANNNVNFIINGTLIVTGTITANNNAILGGTGTIAGGTLSLGGSGGSAPACQSGGCPTINFKNCSNNPFCSTNNVTASSYVWNGASSTDWQNQNNWTPTRTTPASTDFLTFSGSGANKAITNVPTQTIDNMLVTGSSTYSFTPAASGNSLSLSNTTGNAFQIDNLSTLSIGATSNTLNIIMPANGFAEIGGQLNLVQGSFNISSATLLLHTNSTPLAKTNGQVSSDASTTLKFGDTGFTTGNITLPSAIFNGAPTISTLIMNTTSATLADQTITVGTSSTFISGVLNTNATGQIAFSSKSVPAAETTSSYISGYASMGSSVVGTGSLSYLGMTIASGTDNLGSLTLTRITGASGINTFNGKNSIAARWVVAGSTAAPAGRNVSFSWRSAFDNGSTSTLKFQTYLSTGSGFNPIGALQLLSSAGPPRQSATASTTLLNNGTFTLSDENNALPVTVLNFKGKQKVNDVLLNWETSSELNFDYFLIEKSLDGSSFKEIGKIKGHGTTKQRQFYQFIDEKPSVGKNYYRLKSVDFDGYSEYFDIISVDFTNEKQFSVYPNPSDGKVINAYLNFKPEQAYGIIILDNFGLEIARFTASEEELLIQFTNPLSRGMYFSKIIYPDFIKTVRFVVNP